MTRAFTDLAEFVAVAGQELGSSDWITIDQARVDTFADATGDHQWIHVDVDRAAGGPFGGTIAHGYLTLSLLPVIAASAFTIEQKRMGVNYGLNKVRFPAPVPVGSKVRGTATLISASPVSSGTQVVISFVIECDGTDKPVCIAEAVFIYS